MQRVCTLEAGVCLIHWRWVSETRGWRPNDRLEAQGGKTCIQLHLIFSVSHSSHSLLKTQYNIAVGVFVIQDMLSYSRGRRCFCVSVKYRASFHNWSGLWKCSAGVNNLGRGLEQGHTAIIFGRGLCQGCGSDCDATQPRDIVAVALAPVCFLVLHVVRHTTALEPGAVAQSLAGLPASALIPSASCGSSGCEKTKCVCVSLCILRKLQKTVADCKACRCIEACTLSFWGKIQGEFIYFEICWGFHLLLDQVYSAATPQCYKWQSLKDVNDGSKTAILLFKGNFFKCETSGLVHFTKGMSSINKLIWKRVEETTLPFSLPLYDMDCVSFDLPILSALLSFQYLSFQRSSKSLGG